MAEIEITGARQLEALGLRLKALGAAGNGAASVELSSLGRGKTLRSQLLSGIRTGAKPAIEATRQAARTNLPKRGKLNESVATTAITVNTRLTGAKVGVRIGVPKGRKKSNKVYGANKGVVRHPVFGEWLPGMPDQNLGDNAAGWFDKTLRREVPKTIVPIRAAMEAVALEATRRL
jgi:hypothetical protein